MTDSEPSHRSRSHRIDCLQYSRTGRRRSSAQMREGGVDAVHVTIAYHEIFRETVAEHREAGTAGSSSIPELIMPGRSGGDVRRAKREWAHGDLSSAFRTCSPIEDDIGLVEIAPYAGRALHAAQLQQPVSAWRRAATRRRIRASPAWAGEVIKEMNRVGLVVDMSHSAERSSLEAIEISERPIAITHANPAFWHPALRNKSDDLLQARSASRVACWASRPIRIT